MVDSDLMIMIYLKLLFNTTGFYCRSTGTYVSKQQKLKKSRSKDSDSPHHSIDSSDGQTGGSTYQNCRGGGGDSNSSLLMDRQVSLHTKIVWGNSNRSTETDLNIVYACGRNSNRPKLDKKNLAS